MYRPDNGSHENGQSDKQVASLSKTSRPLKGQAPEKTGMDRQSGGCRTFNDPDNEPKPSPKPVRDPYGHGVDKRA